jgi:hypothetical protein
MGIIILPNTPIQNTMNTILQANDVATLALQEQRQKYSTYSGDELKGKLMPKFDAMSCIHENEIALRQTRTLRVIGNTVMDITDSLNPRIVDKDEVYYIGW